MTSVAGATFSGMRHALTVQVQEGFWSGFMWRNPRRLAAMSMGLLLIQETFKQCHRHYR